MNVLTLRFEVSIRKRIAKLIIEFLKIWLVIKPLQIIFQSKNEQSLLSLKSCPENSVGKDVLKMIEEQNLKLIPFYESHDVKHLILGYGMTSENEIRMQAYLFGNGNRSLSCLLFLFAGVLLPSS